MILLMEKNPANQLRLIVYPIIYDGFYTSKRLFGISEPSTLSSFEVGLLSNLMDG